MVTHIVLLQPKPQKPAYEITNTLAQVEALQHTIPGIVDVQAGKNMSDYNQGYTYGFFMRFVDTDHLKAYAPHPAHQIVSQELQRICLKIIDFDIE